MELKYTIYVLKFTLNLHHRLFSLFSYYTICEHFPCGAYVKNNCVIERLVNDVTYIIL